MERSIILFFLVHPLPLFPQAFINPLYGETIFQNLRSMILHGADNSEKKYLETLKIQIKVSQSPLEGPAINS